MRELPILSAVVFIMALGLVILGLVALCAPLPLPLPLVTPTTTVTTMPSPTDTPMPTNTPSPTETPKPHVHTPVPITETSSVTLPSVGGSNFASLQFPPGTTVVYGGCARDGTCYPFNFYWALTREAVLTDPSEQRSNQETHELCHAHQHWSINGGAPLVPSDYDLESWYRTGEGQSFMAAVDGLAFPWTLSAVNGIEDFAWTCAFWYKDPQRLLDVGGQVRYDWASKNLP